MKLHDRLAQIDEQTKHRVQRGRTQLAGTSITITIDPVDVSRATASIEVQGTDAPYSYTVGADTLTVAFSETVQAWINWEVRD